jgi:hypothetical protein
MAGARVNNYSPSTADLTSLMTTVDGDRTGYVALSLTEYASTSRPEISGGSIIEVAGALFRFSTTEAISTASVTSTAAQFYYIEIAPTSSQCSAQFSTTVSVWREDLQGYYQSTISNNRHIGKTYFTGADYTVKNMITVRDKYATNIFHCREEQASGTHGGTFTAGAWRTRVLNTILTNDIGASLASNQITLPPGKYKIHASCPAYFVDGHKAILYNVTAADTSIVGTSEYAYVTAATPTPVTRSFVNGVITISVNTVFELRHRCEATTATTGLGCAVTLGVAEVYSEIIIEKIT